MYNRYSNSDIKFLLATMTTSTPLLQDKDDPLEKEADTFSQSSGGSDYDPDDDESLNDGDDDDDDDDDDADDDDDEPMSWKSLLLGAWKQHLMAMVVALLASVASHYHAQANANANGGRTSNVQHPLHPKHPHLEAYVRTANISFCNSLLPLAPGSNGNRLELMDFYVQPQFVDIMRLYYQADYQEDDFYERISQVDLKSSEELLSNNPEVMCLMDQASSQARVRGTTYYYKSPTFEDMYPDEQPSTQLTMKPLKRKLTQPHLAFTGFAAKFINLSPKPVLLHWDGKGGHDDARRLVGEIPPFESLGTATQPGQSFYVSPVYDSSTALQRWVVTSDTALVIYEPHKPQELQSQLEEGSPDFFKYQMQLLNQVFARDYLIATQRTWLANFPRPYPVHYMHPAEYMGQEHVVDGITLTVASVTPRAFVMDNFLTPEECKHLIELSQEQGLHASTLHSGSDAPHMTDLSTRSSTNTWLPRVTSNVTERIYEKAAKLLKIDPELFQKHSETDARHHSIAESLQVVRYKKAGEEYQPHHDFVYPSIKHRYQPTRFATLLFYLNTVPEGGETRFPKAVNSEFAEGVEIQPVVGRAVLFYNMLPDGNVDDLSQHGSNPTTNHEKWLANLWVSTQTFAGQQRQCPIGILNLFVRSSFLF
jgi:prolyl 4-hydroxylase